MTAPSVMVRTENLTKRDSERNRVDSLTFEVLAGQIVGLLGPNGSGKTTALKMLVGLIRPTHGFADVLGCRVGSPGFPSALHRVGALIESPALYGQLTVRQNLIAQARVLRVGDSAKRIAELLDLVDLGDRADSRASTLSLGMKQRLGIALALIAKPELVLLDEPANGLDPAGIVEIRNLLRRLPELGTTVLVSSHQLAEVQQACDRLIVMTAGHTVANGTTNEILHGFSGNRFVIRLEAADLLVSLECLTNAGLQTSLDPAGSQITVTLPDHWTGQDLNRTLSTNNIHAIEIRHETATLEEAFLAMTSTGPKDNHAAR
jgi:ABC-type multidrug transport system ATPase subunit